MTIIAIDPGSSTGAFAIVNSHLSEVHDIPVADGQIDAAGFARLVRLHRPSTAVLENVHAMPKQGVVSTFKFGVSVGIIRGVLAALQIPTHLVAPTVWKRAYNLIGTDKDAARAKAVMLFPRVEGLHLKKHQGRADALLMGHYFHNQQRHVGLWKAGMNEEGD